MNMGLIEHSRIIAHIDMNSYFASCEQQDNLAWRGLPVGVCEHLGGIIIAASVEAKRWGIKTGTPVWEARQLFPKIILTKTNPARYRKYTARFLKVFEDYTDKVEKYSIDEAFLDLTKSCVIEQPDGKGGFVAVDPWVEAARIANEIKLRMKTEVGDWIRCSVGVADNKLLAKIGSDMKKPDGLTIIRPEDRESMYDKLDLIDIPGIGRRMKRNLQYLGIGTLRQLRDYPVSKLVAKFGIMGQHLHQMGQLQGSWKERFDVVEPIKSIGHMYTMPAEYRKRVSLEPVLYKLSEMVGARLRMNGLEGNVVSVHVHDAEYNCAGKSERLGFYLNDGRELFLEAIRMLNGIGGPNETWRKAPYLIGVTVAGVQNQVAQQSLFVKDKHSKQLAAALDSINTKYDDFTVARVPAFLARDIIRDSIGFGRMKEFKTSSTRGSHGRFS